MATGGGSYLQGRWVPSSDQLGPAVMNAYIYIKTQVTSIFEGQPSKTRPFLSKNKGQSFGF